MSEKQQRLVLSIIDFLNKSIKDGSVKADDKEGLEIAIQCIGEAFGVDPADDKQAERLSVKPATLEAIFDVFLKTRTKASSVKPEPTEATTSPSATAKAEAETHKQNGNALMTRREYGKAIDMYTKAIELDPTNPVYFSNRAAAYSSNQDHHNAITDANKAIEADPSFSKAYHRLGHAHYSLGEYAEASSAFRRGLDIDPSNASLKSGLQNADARIASTSPPGTSDDAVPSTGGGGGFADMLRGMGGAGGAAGAGAAGGVPDIASMMNNPAMMSMAQQMMANGGLERLMQNPSVADMMNRVQSGGALPSMQEILGDPSLRNLASQFMGGGGAPGGPDHT